MTPRPLPQFDQFGLLPNGIYELTTAEIEALFVAGRSTNRRDLFQKLLAFLDELDQAGFAATVILDGSFVMDGVDGEAGPDDIDLILVMPEGWDMEAPVRPFEYNLLSRRMTRRKFRLEAFSMPAGSAAFQEWSDYFSQVNTKWCGPLGIPVGTTKGLVKVIR